MKILLTGNTGFIGSLLVPELQKRGHEVEVIERYVAGRYGKLDRDPSIKTHFVNLEDFMGVSDTFKEVQPDVIFHLAALSPVSFSYTHPFETLNTDFMATVNLAEVARKHVPNLKHFISSGTTEEYGNSPDRPATEESRCWPNSPYAAAKLASTNYLQYMHRTYGFPMTVMRSTNTYGRVNDTHFFIERLIAQMIKGGPIKMGGPDAIRDFLYVDDHVSAYLEVLSNREKSIGKIFNFSTERSMTIREAATIIMNVCGYKGDILWNQVPARPNDIFLHTISSQLIRNTLGWKHKVEFEDGVKRLYDKLTKAL